MVCARTTDPTIARLAPRRPRQEKPRLAVSKLCLALLKTLSIMKKLMKSPQANL